MSERTEVKLRLIYRRLHADRKVESQKEFGEKVDFNNTSITHMIKGEKPLPFRMVKNLYNVFGVNANYVIADDEAHPFYVNEMLSVDQKEVKAKEESFKDKLETCAREIKDLKQRILDKEKIIQLLEKGK